ncbi:hypothetical protein [Photobacterium alginatilyticum]|uniref:Uncharacterized protein n=1 Tax=Photobacterium alginatilyticum TaxID=1775171 RepID=A0ABW9YLG8_9GAMM|nr:hypothetical protein [Photobacterium alginatilyticum]NBI54560.1 hypothetical protein [Photobacterium alginatilyticum]
MHKLDLTKMLKWETVIYLSHALFLSVIISTGGVIQELIDGLLFGVQANLIDSIYEGGIALNEYHLFDWATSPHLLTLILPCYFVVLMSLKPDSATRKNLTLMGGLYVLLCVSDTLINLFYKDVDFVPLSTHYIYNFFGALAIFLFYKFIVLANRKLLLKIDADSKALFKLIEPAIMAAVSVLYLTLLFVTQSSTMAVSPSHINITIEPPLDFFYSTKNNSDSDKHRGFDIPIGKSRINELDWKLFSTDMSVDYLIDSSVSTALEVRVLNGCGINPTISEIEEYLALTPAITIPNISNTLLEFDDGQVDIKLLSDGFVNEGISLDSSSIKQASITLEDDEEKYRISRFIAYDETISHNSWEGTTTYIFFLSDFLQDKEKPMRTARIASKEFNAKFNFSFVNFNLDKPIDNSCTSLPISKNDNYEIEAPIGGLALTFISDNNRTPLIFRQGKHSSSIEGVSGWVFKEHVDEKQLKRTIDNGLLSFIAGSAKITSLNVDGKPYSVHDRHSIAIQKGEIGASHTDNGTIRLVGSAGVFFLDNKRVNQSRWEKLGTEYQLAILTIIFSTIAFCVNQFVKHTQNNQTNTKEQSK